MTIAGIAHNAEIQALAAEIEQRRIDLGKTSGFDKMYAGVTCHLLRWMALSDLAELRPFLKPGAYLGYVVGDQASFFQVLIQTGRLLADIAAEFGVRSGWHRSVPDAIGDRHQTAGARRGCRAALVRRV